MTSDEAFDLAARRLEARATSEQIDAERGPLVRDGMTKARLHAADVLRQEADWIRRLKDSR